MQYETRGYSDDDEIDAILIGDTWFVLYIPSSKLPAFFEELDETGRKARDASLEALPSSWPNWPKKHQAETVVAELLSAALAGVSMPELRELYGATPK